MGLKDILSQESSTKGSTWLLTNFPHIKTEKDEKLFGLYEVAEDGTKTRVETFHKVSFIPVAQRGQYTYFDGTSFKLISEIVQIPKINSAKNLKKPDRIVEQEKDLYREKDKKNFKFYQITLGILNRKTPVLWYIKGATLSQFMKFEEENGKLLGRELLLEPLKKTTGGNTYHVPILKGINEDPEINDEVVEDAYNRFKDAINKYNTKIYNTEGDDDDVDF